MVEILFRAYTPLLLWPGLGWLVYRVIPHKFPKLLGQALYWVGVPLQLLVLGRQTELSPEGRVIPLIAVGVVLATIALAQLCWWGLQQLSKFIITLPQERQNFFLRSLFVPVKMLDQTTQGSFILAALLSNTGFVGLTITQVLFGPVNNDLAVLYSVTNNVIGTYGIAVFIASYFGAQSAQKGRGWRQVRDVLLVPSIWTFIIGFNTRTIPLPAEVETGLNQAVWVVIALALLLVGLRLASLKEWGSFKLAIIPTLLKVLIVPLFVGLSANYFGMSREACLVLTIMSGTPTGLSVLILAEVYDLNRDLATCTIALSFMGMLFALPLWLAWFA